MVKLSHLEKCRIGYRLKKERERNPPPPQPAKPRKPRRPLRPDEWEDCGCANGWGDNVPERVRDCKHITVDREIGRCLRETSCDICKYRFTVDSGD